MPPRFDPVPSFSLSLSLLSDYLIFRFPLSSFSFPLGHPYQPFTPVHYLTTQEFITIVSIPPFIFEFSHDTELRNSNYSKERCYLLLFESRRRRTNLLIRFKISRKK